MRRIDGAEPRALSTRLESRSNVRSLAAARRDGAADSLPRYFAKCEWKNSPAASSRRSPMRRALPWAGTITRSILPICLQALIEQGRRLDPAAARPERRGRRWLARQAFGALLDNLPKIGTPTGEVNVGSDLARLLNLTDKLAQQRKDQFISTELFVLAADRGQVARSASCCAMPARRRTAIERAIDAMRGGARRSIPPMPRNSVRRWRSTRSISLRVR